jgi:hypothetical protein
MLSKGFGAGAKDFAPDILTLQEQAPERLPRTLFNAMACYPERCC